MSSPVISSSPSHHVLQGKRVLVTRAREQASDLERQLQAVGAEPLAFPTIRIVPPIDDYAALDAALRQLPAFDWVVFTSVNGVKNVWRRLEALGLSTADMAHARLAAIGPATAKALTAKGLEIAVMPPHYVAESLLDAIPSPAGQRFLLPRADIARDALRTGLQAAGAEVVEAPAYHTEPVEPTPEDWAALDQGVDIITFTASSTVHHFEAQVGRERLLALAENALVAAIGPITAESARSLGLRVDVVAENYTIAGLVEAIVSASQTA